MTKPMSDEEIAKRCGLKVSDVRSVLNRLHEYGITAYIRERDKDTGWFSYNWVVNVIKLYEVIEHKKASGAQREEESLAYEKSYTFYTCANTVCTGSGQRIPESDAILTTYACNRCGQSLTVFDNKEIIKSLEQKLAARIPDEQTFVKELTMPKPLAKKAMPRHKTAGKKMAIKAATFRRAPKHAKAKAKAKTASRKAKKRR
ncbi:MAG: hypothetical protein V1909_00745 [Candidatus Micrarchaeota archaeon]